jgi:hypothetical protein
MQLPRRPDPRDNSLFVEFRDEARPNPKAAFDPNAPKYIDIPYIKITTDSFSVLEVPVRDTAEYSDIRRFPDAWEMYLAKKKGERIGTPLKVLDNMTPAQIKNYEASDIYSVEQLAQSSDAMVTKVMGGLADRKKAIAFLEGSDKRFAEAEMNRKFEAIQLQLDAQAEALAKKDQIIAELESKAKSKTTEKVK